MAGTVPRTRRRRRGVAAWALNLGYAGVIASLALLPASVQVGNRDWLFHALGFGLQTALLTKLTRRWWPPLTAVGGAAAGALLYGTLIELLQIAVPSRRFEVRDLLANAIGVAVIAAMLCLGTSSRARRAPEGLT
jgi:VanZ family protein